MTKDISMKRVAEGLYCFTGLLVGRVYLIKDSDGLTVIDAGIPNAADKIVSQIRAAGYQPEDVRRILITHAHGDHIGGLPRLKALTGAQVIAYEVETPDETDRTVTDGEIIAEVMGGLHVLHTPGHANGHVCYWQPERRILFAGDVIMRFVFMTQPFSFVSPDMAENRRSIAQVVDLQPAVVCFGHGRPLTADTASSLQAFAQRVGAVG
jgi:glyoxylase-like metal-dependent hydrolase (beta-lactamase superfamily II)